MKRALIIGGGVAGTVAAMALERAGIQGVICEASRRGGAMRGGWLTVPTNGLDALAAIGLDRLVAERGIAVRRSLFLDHRGRPLGSLPLGGRSLDATPSRVVGRAPLQTLLLEEAGRRGIQIESGKRLVGAAVDDAGGIVAHFDDETEARADLLIGADGLFSAVRACVDADAPPPRYAGMVHFAGRTPGVAAGAEAGCWSLVLARRAFFGALTDDQGGTLWFVNQPRVEVDAVERAETTPDAWRQRLIELFDEEEGPMRATIAAGALELAAENQFDLPPQPRWHAGPIVLIGDAAHAPLFSSGQGAAMAMEDAIELARCLRDLPDPERAFAAYEALRRRRVERVAAEGRRGVVRRMPGRLGRGLRNAALRIAFRWYFRRRALAWLYDHHLDWEGSVAAKGRPLRVRRRG